MTEPLGDADRPYLVVPNPDDQVFLEGPMEWTILLRADG